MANTPAKQKKKFNGDNTNDMEKNEKSALVAVFREKLNWKKQALAESNSYLLKWPAQTVSCCFFFFFAYSSREPELKM